MTNEETKDCCTQIFKTFFKLISDKDLEQPKHIVTDADEVLAFKFSLLSMKEEGTFTGNQTLDILYVLRNLKVTLKNKEDLPLFQRLIKC